MRTGDANERAPRLSKGGVLRKFFWKVLDIKEKKRETARRIGHG